MKIILIPVSPKELEKITITSEQFPIGRQEIPFSNYTDAIQKVLSRRHARIFVQDGQPYIIDMGSINGTAVNNVEVRDRPHALQHGDQICLANELTYKVEIDTGNFDQKITPKDSRHLYLYMTPEDGQSTIDSIVIMSFPFMVSRADDVFSRYQNDVPEEVSFLSRRHAYIFEKNESLYIEDLKSANGTFLNGEMLKDEVVQLKSGDVLAFGGCYFRYCIRIEGEKNNIETDKTLIQQSFQPNKPNIETEMAGAAVQNENKTLFISSATSFLDIFCFQEKVDSEEAGEGEDNSEQEKLEKNVSKPQFFPRQRMFLDNFVSAFHDGESKKNFNIKIFALVVLGVVAVGMGWYFLSAEKTSITMACNAEKHAKCMEASVAYLSSGKIDGEIIQLASNAALKRYLPDWIEKVVNRRDERSDAINELTVFQNDIHNALSMNDSGENGTALEVYSHLPTKQEELPKAMKQLDDTIALLKKVDALELFIAQRGGGDGKITIDNDEKKITDIVDNWQENTDTDRRIMLDIITQVPQFDELRMLVFSHLRDLRNDKSLYLSAIRSFKEHLNNVGSNNENQMLAEVDKLQQKYPRIIGLDAYRDDIRLYHKIKDAQQGSSENALNIQGLASQFKTALFSDLYVQELREKLPKGDVAGHFSKALEQWQAGLCEESISSLKEIQDSQWIELAQAEANRRKTLCQQFDKLNKGDRGEDYDSTLLQFYAGLKKEKDKYFINQIETEILAYKNKLQDKAAVLFQKAVADWENYARQGRIKKLQLLESDISAQFKEQSKKLVQANQYIDQVKIIYHLLDMELTAGQKETVESIVNELDYQRKALEDLSHVSGSSQMAEAKLKLLGK